MLFNNLSIKNKVILIIQIVSLSSLLIGFVYVIFNNIASFKEDMKNNTVINATLIGDYCAVPLAFEVYENANETLEKLKLIPSVDVGIIYDKNHEIFAEFYKKGQKIKTPPLAQNKSWNKYEGDYLYVAQSIYYDNKFTGTIFLKVSTKELTQKISNYILTMSILLIILLIVNYFLAVGLQRLISEPIIKLTNAARVISNEGNYLMSVPKESEDEVGELVTEFNKMLNQIHIREDSLKTKSEELTKTLDDLRLTQEKLINTEKLVALGKLIAGVAHEINTPLGAIRSSAGTIGNDLNFVLNNYPKFAMDLEPQLRSPFYDLIQNSIQKKNSLTSKEERIIKKNIAEYFHSKGVANSYAAADTFVDMTIFENLDPYLPLLTHEKASPILEMAYRLTSLYSSTANIEMAADRASKVVFALKNSSRIGNSDELVISNIIDGIESVLTLYSSQIKQGIKVVKNFQTIPQIACYRDELNQVWTNIIHNAIYAMSLKGKLTIETYTEEQYVVVAITDDGTGINPNEIDKIFDPFFTTKPEGEGTGLGLDISKRIIEKHYGKITVKSKVGQTRFKVYLPINNGQNSFT